VNPYDYAVSEVVKVTDGDTYWFRLDVGFRETLLVNVRLDGFDAPELNSGDTYERQKGAEAKAVAAQWFGDHYGLVRVATKPDPDSFGRWLGQVYAGDSLLGDVLRAEGLASIWPTRWHQEFEPA
jgi:endonuclease YncB( thermonuclease family)